jgi:osmoprotectant transport system substrate-binding protein
MKITKAALAAGLSATLLLLAACGGGGNPLAENSPSAPASPSVGGEPVVVGSAGFTESQILAELYAQAMQAKGVPASTKLNIGTREVYLKALQEGSISVMPEYTGNLLVNFDRKTTAKTAADVEAALSKALPAGLQVLKSSEAADQDIYVVTKEYSEQNGITSLGDLTKVADRAVLGGPPELETRTYGPKGLKELYGVTLKGFEPYTKVPVKVKDLNDGKIQVATFFTTESAIADNGYVQLEDPKSMILPQNVVPLVRSNVAENSQAVDAIESVQSALSTADLLQLNKLVNVEQQDPDQVAADWLKLKGLA